jgi:hypothetical protein
MPLEILTETVFEGSEADAVLVKLALEREGIRCFIVDQALVRTRRRGSVQVSPSNAVRARQIIARHLKGASPSDAALAPAWQCAMCGEMVEGQFQACWNCGAPKP